MIRRVLTAALTGLGLVLLVAPVASAHDELISSVPAEDFSVTELPAFARFVFEEETRAEDLTVTAQGRQLPVALLGTDGHTVTADLAGVRPTETVALDWRVVDEHDGHVTHGVLTFHVLNHVGATSTPVAAPAAVVPGGLVSSIPSNGFTLTVLPKVARLTFSTATRPRDVAVTSDGHALLVAAYPGDPKTVSVDLAGVRATETVVLDWKVIRKGQKKPITGTVAFHVLEHIAGGPAGSAAGGSPGGRDQPLHNLSVVTHVVGYLAMAVLIGGLFFVSVLWPAGASDRRTRLLLGSAAAAGLASAITAVYVATEQVAPLAFRDAIAQHFGRVTVAVALMWLLASVVLVAVLQQPDSVRKAAWRVGALVVAIGLIRATGMSAHGTQGSSATSGLVVDFLHLTAVSAWVGGLTVMTVGLLPRRKLEELQHVVPRFSKVAATSVLLVVASGTVLAWQLIGSFGGLFSTHYGRVLIVKLVLVGLVLLAALVSKRWVEQRLASITADGDANAVRTFVASVGAEAVLVIAVLGVASVLVTASPGL